MTKSNRDQMLQWARYYRDKFDVVPIAIDPYGKAPVRKGWQKETGTDEELEAHLKEDGNLGLLLGESSGNLIDVDLDSGAARRWGPRFLSPTAWVSGHARAPRSHFWYQATDEGRLPGVKQWHKPIQGTHKEGDKATWIELRSTGGQTVVPPSLHPDHGVRYEWSEGAPTSPPAKQPYSVVEKACRFVYAACLLDEGWIKGQRHFMSLPVVGSLLYERVRPELVLEFCKLLDAEGEQDWEKHIEDTQRRIAAEQPVAGVPKLGEYIGVAYAREFVRTFKRITDSADTRLRGGGADSDIPSALTEANAIGEEIKLSRREEILLLLDRKPGNRASHEKIRKKLEVGKSRLSNLLKKEREGEQQFRVIHEHGRSYVVLSRGRGFTAADLEGPPQELPEIAGWLPGNFHDFIAPELGGLDPKSFVMFAGHGDAGKTLILIATAVHNAKKGKKVCFITHEDDKDNFRKIVATMENSHKLRPPRNRGEAFETFTSLPEWRKNISLMVADAVVNLDAFVEAVHREKPDLVVYDYLNQSLIDMETKEQRSLLASIVQKIGREIVDKGIPFITAVQLGLDGKEASLNPTWQQRANVMLFIEKTVAELKNGVPTGNVCHYISIRKNKQGTDEYLTRKLKLIRSRESLFIITVERMDDKAWRKVMKPSYDSPASSSGPKGNAGNTTASPGGGE